MEAGQLIHLPFFRAWGAAHGGRAVEESNHIDIIRLFLLNAIHRPEHTGYASVHETVDSFEYSPGESCKQEVNSGFANKLEDGDGDVHAQLAALRAENEGGFVENLFSIH